MKLLVISIMFVVCLIHSVGLVSAQEPLPPIPDQRVPITPENAEKLQLLGAWQTGNVTDVSWLTDQHLAVQNPLYTLIYNVDNLDEPDAIIAGTGIAPRLSPDGNWLVFEDSFNGFSITVWNTQTGASRDVDLSRSFASYREPRFIIWGAPARLIIAVVNKLYITDLNQMDETAVTTQIHPSSERTDYEIIELAVAPDGRQLFTLARALISDQLVLRAWNLDTLETRVLFESDFLSDQYLDSLGLQFNPDASEIALLVKRMVGERWDHDYVLYHWELNSGRELPGSTITNEKWITGWTFAYGAYVAKDYYNCYLGTFEDPAQTIQLPLWTNYIDKCALERFGADRAVFFDSEPGVAYLYRLDDQTETPLEVSDKLAMAVISPDGSRIAARDELGRLIVWQTDQPNAPVFWDYRSLFRGERDIGLSPNGNKLLVVAPESVREFDLLTGEQRLVIEEAGEHYVDAVYHPDGNSFIIADSRGAIRSYGAEDYMLQFVLWGTGSPQTLAFSEDGQLLAVVLRDVINIWQVSSQTIITQLTDYNSSSGTIAFLEDGQWLAYGNQLWRVENQGHLIAIWDWRHDDTLPPSVLAYFDDRSFVTATDTAYRFLLTNDNHSWFELIDLASGSRIWRFNAQKSAMDAVLSDDLLVLSDGDAIYFWGVLPEVGE